MVWTAPVGGMEPGQDITSSHSSTTSVVTPATQARSLAIFSSYLKSQSTDALLALTTSMCPGNRVATATGYYCDWLLLYCNWLIKELFTKGTIVNSILKCGIKWK